MLWAEWIALGNVVGWVDCPGKCCGLSGLPWGMLWAGWIALGNVVGLVDCPGECCGLGGLCEERPSVYLSSIRTAKGKCTTQEMFGHSLGRGD